MYTREIDPGLVDGKCGIVYFLRFDRPVSGKVRWYIGWCEPHRFYRRMDEHHRSRPVREIVNPDGSVSWLHSGAALTTAAREQGITFTPVLKLHGTRSLERTIKNYKGFAALHQRIIQGTSKYSQLVIE